MEKSGIFCPLTSVGQPGGYNPSERLAQFGAFDPADRDDPILSIVAATIQALDGVAEENPRRKEKDKPTLAFIPRALSRVETCSRQKKKLWNCHIFV